MRTGWVSAGLTVVLGCAGPARSPADPSTDATSSSGDADAGARPMGGSTADVTSTATPQTGSTTTGSAEVGTSGFSQTSTGGGVETWDEPVDCRNHRPTAASFVEFSGVLDGAETEGRCDFLEPHDWVNFCQGDAIGFLASCTTPEGMLLSLQIAPVEAGDFVDPTGSPRYGFDVLDGADTYSTGSPNAVHSQLVVETFDEAQRQLSGRFEATFYDLTVSGIRYPAGAFGGDFAISF